MSLYLIPLVFILLFVLNMIIERRNLLSGLTFGLASSTSLLFLILFLESNPFFRQFSFIIPMLYAIAVLVALVILTGPLMLVLVFFYNGIKILRREGLSLRNMLSLGVALFIPAYLIGFPMFASYLPQNGFLDLIYIYVGGTIAYLVLILALYTMSSLVNMIHLSPQKLDYVVVLGAGLMGQEVTPLLAGRIRKGISIYQKNPGSKLIMSGGQGPDEVISEAQAMTNYALMQGVPETDILLENQSRNTDENVRFSYELMPADSHFALVTNSYHIFRALLIAKKEKIRCIGYGARSKFYFSLNAFIREFVAYLVMTRKGHLTVLGLGFVLILLAYVVKIILLLL